MKKLLTTLLITASVASFADGNNLYVGTSAGAAWNNIQNPDAAFRFYGGYNIVPDAFGIEIGTTGLTQSGSVPVNQSMQYYDLSLKGTVPLGDGPDVFLQVGGAYGTPGIPNSIYSTPVSSGFHQAGWNFLTAVGVEYNVSRQFSVNLSDYYYYGAPNPQGNTDVLLGGVKFNF